MANITLWGASYTDVPAVDLPQTGGGTVRFYENGGGGGNAYTRTVIVPEQTVTPTSNGTYYSATLANMTENLESGSDYIVTINGVEWWATCTLLWGTNYLLGDINYFYGSTDLPYPFGLIWTSGTTCTLATGSGSQRVVKVEKIELIDQPSPSGGGLLKIASGTITGNNTYDLPVPVGKKMPKTNFWFRMVAKSTSEFAYNSDYKYAVLFGIVFSEMGQYDLSTVGDGKQLSSNLSFKINNSGTITNAASGTYIGHVTAVRNNTANTYGRFNNMRINRKSNEFQVRLYNSNNSYKAPSTITYEWELVYFGTNPSTEIVEIT